MRVLGIDCGTEFTGWGVVECDANAPVTRLRHVAAGTIRLGRTAPAAERLLAIHAGLSAELARFQPACVAVEEVFFAANAKSALKLGQVRGVALLAAAQAGCAVAEYAPLSIKSAVVGYGLASKEQVQFMVARLLGVEGGFDSADAADALAVAICHMHTREAAGAGTLRAPAQRSSVARPINLVPGEPARLAPGALREPARRPIPRAAAAEGAAR